MSGVYGQQQQHQQQLPPHLEGSEETKWSPPRYSSLAAGAESPSLASLPPPPPPLPLQETKFSNNIELYSEKLQKLPPHVREETEALLKSGLYNEDDTLIQTIFSIHK